MMSASEPQISPTLIEAIRLAERITVLTGSGISAESGVPTFREAQVGLWAQYDPQQLATPSAFKNDPLLVWEWYTWRRELVARADPNPAHMALVKLEETTPVFTLITQNVDNLHQRAGSNNVIELHGNLGNTRCSYEDVPIDSWIEDGERPPRCPHCGSLLRPDVVWFGEALPEPALSKAINAAKQCDMFFSIGTSSIVQPAASIPLFARHNKATLVEINVEQTPLSPIVDYCLLGRAGDILPLIVKAASIR